MKKGCTVIVAIIVLLWIIGSLLPDDKAEESSSDDEVRPERGLATRINNSTFYYSDGQLNSSIKFESDNTGWTGAAILTQLGCRFVYSYYLDGDKIVLTFTGSDCERTSTDKIFYYDESKDHIYTMINGQKYIFK